MYTAPNDRSRFLAIFGAIVCSWCCNVEALLKEASAAVQLLYLSDLRDEKRTAGAAAA